jgi:hypothetical protein
MRQRLVFFMGKYYWQEIPEKDFGEMLDKLFLDLTGE